MAVKPCMVHSVTFQTANGSLVARFTPNNGMIIPSIDGFRTDGKETFSWLNGGNHSVEAPTLAQNGTVYFGGGSWSKGGASFISLKPSGFEAWSYTAANGGFLQPSVGKDGTVYVTHWIDEGSSSFGYEFMSVLSEWRSALESILSELPGLYRWRQRHGLYPNR